MKAFVFVEGPSDVLALDALWAGWCRLLRGVGRGISVIHLRNKTNFLRKIGPRAAEKLISGCDLVVAIPDLYPSEPYVATEWRHSNFEELVNLERRLVRDALERDFGVSGRHLIECIDRFMPSALKYDLEMLLLAAKPQLREQLRTTESLNGKWRTPVEEQNQDRPPKRIVQELFLTKSRERKAYLDTKDAPATLSRVSEPSSLLSTESGQPNCPEFAKVLTWMGTKLGTRCP